jgi:hypothetical protein
VATLHYSGLSLDVLQTVECSRRVEYDGANSYLWTRWRIHVRCLFNPSATSYIARNQNNPFAIDGSAPSYTDQTIRHQLMLPRQKLIYTMAGPGAVKGGPPALNIDGLGGAGGSLVILECPPAKDPDNPNYSGNPGNDRYACDPEGGPTPIACNVRRIDGLRTWHVDYIIECVQNECFNFYSSPAVLLSHRWRMTHDVDRMGFTTRRVQGDCVFRQDALLAAGRNPDSYRNVLLHPIPNNMVRENVVVVADEDPARLRYAFTDRETSHNILNANIARLEAYAVVRRGDQAFLAGLPGLGGLLGDPSPIGVLIALLKGLAGAAIDTLPKIGVTVVVRAWGNRKASRLQLRNVAARVLQLKLPKLSNTFLGINFGPYSTHTETQYDLLGRFVEVRQTAEADIARSFSVYAGTDHDGPFPELIKDDIEGIALTAETAGRMPAAGKTDAGAANISRGSYLAACVAQGLQVTACQNPPAPVNQGAVDKLLPIPGVS